MMLFLSAVFILEIRHVYALPPVPWVKRVIIVERMRLGVLAFEYRPRRGRLGCQSQAGAKNEGSQKARVVSFHYRQNVED